MSGQLLLAAILTEVVPARKGFHLDTQLYLHGNFNYPIGSHFRASIAQQLCVASQATFFCGGQGSPGQANRIARHHRGDDRYTDHSVSSMQRNLMGWIPLWPGNFCRRMLELWDFRHHIGFIESQ